MFSRLGATSGANEMQYNAPEDENADRVRNLGSDVEMKSFKSKAPEEVTRDAKGNVLLKILCVGGYTAGVDTKGLLISDYMRTRPVRMNSAPIIGATFYLHQLMGQSNNLKPEGKSLLRLQFWEIAELECYASMCKAYFRGARGFLIFWGPNATASLQEAVRWKDYARKYANYYDVPLIMIVDNTRKKQWIGPGDMFENAQAVDDFCREHGFITWYEITSRDWDSGEDSVFGHAVHRLVKEILD